MMEPPERIGPHDLRGLPGEVRVHDSTAEVRYIVIPRRPEGTEDMDEEPLAAPATRDSMIGVAPARRP